MKNKVYMAVTLDKYELPIALFESGKEMSLFNGRSVRSNYTAVSRGHIDRKNKCRYVRVLLDEEDEK